MNGSLARLRALLAGAAIALALLNGCATTGDPRDPFEPANRAIYKFNDGFDRAIAKPAAELYRAVFPPIVRTGVGNFFSNINDVIVALNNLLQGKVPEAINDVGRIFVNTTLGVFGIRDVATELGVPKNNEDFGQTLGRWGIGDGPYIVLPLLGPSNVRDTFGWVGDIYTTPLTAIDPNRDRNLIIGFRFVTIRADYLEASNILETAALDPYEFVRDAYLQRRNNLVHDGNPPAEKDPEPAATDQKPKPAAPDQKPAAKPVSEVPAPQSASAGGSAVPTAFPQDQLSAAAPAEAPGRQRSVTRIWLPASR